MHNVSNKLKTKRKEVSYTMGKDRQEKKLRKERRVESDRDTSTHPKGSTYLDTPEQAKKDQKR